ncbi:glycosyltransferase [Marinovum sp.]|uniref:glycosyltransferase n=1 Tax=Marinovum sp. TaxID=2024839 RepID=UPI003A91E15B
MKVAVLAEQNFNLIDGSTIWLLNVCKLLALQSDLETDLLLTHRMENPVLARELPASIRMVGAEQVLEVAGLTDTQLRPDTLIDALSAWEAAAGSYDRIFVRGTEYLTRLLAEPGLRDRVVVYAPSAIPDLSAPEPEWVRLARGGGANPANAIVVQSETAQRALESLYDYPANRVHVVPPIVFRGPPVARPEEGPTVLCYSGKVDLHYGFDWLLDIATAVSDHPDLSVSLIAGKDTYRARYRDFFKRMDGFRRSVEAGLLRGINLVTNVPHAEAKARMGAAHFAYCLRHDRYDDVIEISTKIVEFCTLGVPPILNDNALNRSLFGADYPYYIDIVHDDIPARVLDFLRSRGDARYRAARARIAEISERFSAEALSTRLGRAIRGWRTDAPALTGSRRRIHIPTHERKFLRQFIDLTRSDSKIEISWEPWRSTVKPMGRPGVPGDADTVFCEWCCENAVWHSNNKRPGTKLIVRLHRFEAFRDFPVRVNWANVDALIVVSDWFRDRMIARHGVDPERIHVIPQYIDWQSLHRPKLPEARFTLGLVGINPFEHKRFDRAVEFFAALRAEDPRFRLAVRSAMPWEIEWVWNREDETRARFETVFRRIFDDPDLAASIRFDPAGGDMEEWYRGVGTILSSSDSEGCHTSVLEGMASGALPVVHDWPGARSLFAPHVHEDMRAAIPAVVAFAEAPDLAARREALSRQVQRHDVENFARDFMNL